MPRQGVIHTSDSTKPVYRYTRYGKFPEECYFLRDGPDKFIASLDVTGYVLPVFSTESKVNNFLEEVMKGSAIPIELTVDRDYLGNITSPDPEAEVIKLDIDLSGDRCTLGNCPTIDLT